MAASEEKEFDPTLDSVELNTARVMGHVMEVIAAGSAHLLIAGRQQRSQAIACTPCAPAV